jgi:hypothetical protein
VTENNNTNPENNEVSTGTGYNQVPYDPVTNPPEPYQVPQRPPVTQQFHQSQAIPVQHQQYPPHQYYSHPPMRPKTPEDIRQEKVLYNTIITIVVGLGFGSFMFTLFGFLGSFVTGMATSFMMYRSVKLGGGYVLGLTLTLVNILCFYLFLFIFFWAFQLSGMDMPTFLERLAEESAGA